MPPAGAHQGNTPQTSPIKPAGRDSKTQEGGEGGSTPSAAAAGGETPGSGDSMLGNINSVRV
jgi:hypothetical protein